MLFIKNLKLLLKQHNIPSEDWPLHVGQLYDWVILESSDEGSKIFNGYKNYKAAKRALVIRRTSQSNLDSYTAEQCFKRNGISQWWPKVGKLLQKYPEFFR